MSVAVPSSPSTYVLLTFDASATADPDPGDAVASFAWTFRALDDQCAPPSVAGTGPVATVRFGCDGRYAVDVTATDEMDASSTRTTEFDVVPYSGPSLLTVGGDTAVHHVCTSTPRCTTVGGPVTVSAETHGILPEQVTFAWTVAAPGDRPIDTFRRVVFSPSAASAAPSVSIETDGEAISGDWIFHVEARDAAGVIGTAAVRVSVMNRAPVVQETVPVPTHAFEGSRFTASGEVPYTLADPDGDAMTTPVVEWRHAGDGASAFTGTVLASPSRVAFSIVVPYGAPADAYHLIGGAGLERTVVFDVSDVNGGRTVATWPIVVGDRPPVLVSTPSGVAVPHAYDAPSARYTATAPLSTWSDPDGDPMFQVPGSETTDPSCPTLVVEGGAARAVCALSFTGTPGLANFVGVHAVSQRVQDPWREALAPASATFEIQNQAPVITSTDVVHIGGCTLTADCCRLEEGVCMSREAWPPQHATVASRWSDPDGDPISVEVASDGSFVPVQPLVCTGDCPLEIGLIYADTVCTGTPPRSFSMQITDGAAVVQGTLPVEICG